MAISTWTKSIGLLITSAAFWAVSANATLVSCGDSYRTASLDSAESCYSQIIGSTAKQQNINTIFGGSWTNVGELQTSGSNSFLTVSGSGWGAGNASGSWIIDPSFWNTFGAAVISMHVGGGQKNAVDNFEWLVTPETVSGLWSYTKSAGKGGGLSNIKLWGSGTPSVKVPEPATLLLLLIGLMSVVLVRQKAK